MKGLLSTGASRAWLGVAIAGFAIVLLVLVLSLIPRLGSGQAVLDEAGPAFADARVDGTRAGIGLVSQYVDVVDPLLTKRGGGRADVSTLIRIMRRRMGLTTAQVRRILRREAPHVEALTRALPLDRVADEVPGLTAYLAVTLGTTEDDVAATLEQDFPRISQSLTALRNSADGWYDVPGIDGLTRIGRGKPVRTMPGLRKYYRDDLVPRIVERRRDVQRLAGSGGIGYVPYLLLVCGLALLALGVFNARRARRLAPGRLSWALVLGVGVVVLLFVAIAQYFPRLAGAQRIASDFEPVFTQQRVRGAANGVDTVHDVVAFGDPLMTPAGGAAGEAPQLYGFVAQRTGRSTRDVRRALRKRAPKLSALLDAVPLTQASAELPHLVRYLAKALHLPGDKLEAKLRRRAPGLTQALLTLPDVTAGWSAIPGGARMTRFDAITPVRSMTDFDDYLRQDLATVLVAERADFERFAGGRLSLDKLAPALLIGGVVLLLYSGLMMQLVARRY